MARRTVWASVSGVASRDGVSENLNPGVVQAQCKVSGRVVINANSIGSALEGTVIQGRTDAC